MSDAKQLAENLRKTAAKFRKEAEELAREKHIKCAQVLTAAKGLAQLKRILGGAER